MKDAIIASHKVFPYTSITNTKYFKTPNWILYLNYQSNKLKRTKDIMKHFLTEEDYDGQKQGGKDLEIEQVNNILFQDIDTAMIDSF
tara:strand:+ start:241 stop:501 length:261 start_codon:yes stop_codon:yes gene_type:complete